MLKSVKGQNAAKKMNFFINLQFLADFLQIWPYLLNKFLIGYFFLCSRIFLCTFIVNPVTPSVQNMSYKYFRHLNIGYGLFLQNF